MILFDAHAHLGAGEFAEDLPAVLARAEAVGVCGILAVGETLEEAERLLALAGRHPLIRPAAGLYPTILDQDAAEAMIAFVRRHADRLVALGEVGLDHWVVKDLAGWKTQEEILARFVSLSNDLDLPLNVHSRSAGRHTITFLTEQGARRVLMHAFDGKASAAAEGVRAGFFFSIPPSVVRSPQKQKLVRHLPLECLLLETDSPVLGPDPTARNEPRNVTVACEAVAGLKGIPAEEVARITTENARRLFPRAFA
ncbi:MAG TPA: TatD family hydrolase [Candidatus Methylomirabilis sp.]|nr:TatD family hydrolase [Candidatus Methylomirabilis sp.]